MGTLRHPVTHSEILERGQRVGEVDNDVEEFLGPASSVSGYQTERATHLISKKDLHR